MSWAWKRSEKFYFLVTLNYKLLLLFCINLQSHISNFPDILSSAVYLYYSVWLCFNCIIFISIFVRSGSQQRSPNDLRWLFASILYTFSFFQGLFTRTKLILADHSKICITSSIFAHEFYIRYINTLLLCAGILSKFECCKLPSNFERKQWDHHWHKGGIKLIEIFSFCFGSTPNLDR